MAFELNCADCGETLIKPRGNETVVNGATVAEHMEQTGHQPTLDGHAEPRYQSENAREEHRRQVREERGEWALDRLVDVPILGDDEVTISGHPDFGVKMAVPRDKFVTARFGASSHPQDHQRELDALIDSGCSPAEALDYYMTTERGFNQTEWAKQRGITPQSVNENVAKAREKLS